MSQKQARDKQCVEEPQLSRAFFSSIFRRDRLLNPFELDVTIVTIVEGSLEVEERKRKSQKNEDRRKKIEMRKMLGKSRNTVFFQ